MKIGIDAKWYFTGPSSGKVVVENLVNNLIEQNTKCHTIVLFVLSKEAKLFKEVFSEFISLGTVEIIPVDGKFNFFINIFKVQNLAIKNGVDVILYQNFVPLIPSKRLKTVAYIHDFLFISYPQFFTISENLIYRLMVILAKKANHIVTISNSEKQRIKEILKIKDDKISVVYHGVSSKFKQYSIEQKKLIRLKYGLPDTFLLYIGRLNVRKNISVLVESLKYLNSSIPLVLVGKKDHKSFDIDKHAKENGVSQKIITLGFLPEEDLVKVLASSSVFCFPSFVEGFGLPPLEAMQTGVPVVTTKGTAIPEVCEDAALYFHPDNPKELAIAINYILSDNRLNQELIEKGLKQSSKFSWKISAIQLLSILENL